MKDETEVLHIAVTLKQEADYMVFTIIDDGVGMDENTVKEINSEIRTAVRGFGLKNVSIRIQLQYGQDYGVKVYSKINEGTRVLIKLPIVRSREKDKL